MAATSFQWTQPMVPHCTSSSQTLASAISSPSSRRRNQNRRRDAGALFFRVERSNLLGTPLTQLQRSRSCGYTQRACSARFDASSEEEFSKKIQELALRFQLSNDDLSMDSESGFVPNFRGNHSGLGKGINNFVQNGQRQQEFPNPKDEADWAWSIERKANSVELPLSLRIIKRKIQWEDGLREAGESAYCSVKKAFSSMVFIIRELQSFTLQMREGLYFEDLQGILARVQRELHASLVWLFQQVFSQTPTLMVYVMILLANFTVYSMGCNAAIAAPPPSFNVVATESVSVIEHHNLDSSRGMEGGNNGGGGRIASGTDGEGRADQCATSIGTTSEEEAALWNSMVEEALNLQAMVRDEALDHDTVKRFVSPMTAKIASDDCAEYFKTELVYQRGLSQDPHNSLLLANYAQFLYLVAHHYDRAEEYFKRAIKVEPPDAEAFNKYATFLWKARNETWAAEETYLEAINADPTNTYYAGNYAHFLWNTGGEDTCFPLQDDHV